MTGDRRNENVSLFKGSNFLKLKLLLATLSGKSIQITDIRRNEEKRGLKEFEVSLIRLFDKITNGTVIELSDGGTKLFYQPGVLHGGNIQHDCCTERGIGYYLDILVALGPFCKNPLNVTMKGVTNSSESPSVDHIKASAFASLKKFLVVDEGLELKVIKRGMMPMGGGEITFKCPVRKNIKSIQCIKFGMVKRIRGTVYACKVSPTFSNRTVESAKGVMLNFLPDIYIHTDQNKGKLSGNSSGYGVNLTAETTDNIIYSVEVVSNQQGAETTLPENLGKDAAYKLLDEIYRGGCCDSTFQWMVCLFMALGQKNVTKFLSGPLSQYTMSFLQLLREFFGVTFKLENYKDELLDEDNEEEAGSNKVMMTCVGIGYSNISKRVT